MGNTDAFVFHTLTVINFLSLTFTLSHSSVVHFDPLKDIYHCVNVHLRLPFLQCNFIPGKIDGIKNTQRMVM